MNFDRYPSRCAPPTVHRGPDPSSPRRLKSAFQSAMRRASAFADAKDNSPVGAGRPRAEGLPRPNSFGAHADRRPKAFVPIEIGLPRRCTPSVGLRRRKRQSSGRRRPTVGRRPPQAEFIRRAGRPPAEGLRADGNRSLQALHAKRRPSPTQKTILRSAQADRRPKAPPGRIHSACRPTTGRRPPQAAFIRHAGHPAGIARA